MDTNDHLKNFKEEFLGSLSSDSHKKEDISPVPGRIILSDLNVEGAIIRSYCSGCGNMLQLKLKMVEEFKNSFEWDHLPSILNGEYIHTDGCPVCQKEVNIIEIKTYSQKE